MDFLLTQEEVGGDATMLAGMVAKYDNIPKEEVLRFTWRWNLFVQAFFFK